MTLYTQKNSALLCANLIRTYDRDRFLISLFFPYKIRESLWGLFAFNHEIAKTQEVVSDSNLGYIRLQWWRENIQEIYNSPKPAQSHYILDQLAQAITEHNLPLKYFESLIRAREYDLGEITPQTLEDTIEYARSTNAPLMALAALITGRNTNTDPTDIVAINYAVTGLLRAVPFHAAQHKLFIPQKLMEENNITLQNLKKNPDSLQIVVRSVSEKFDSTIRPDNTFLKLSQKLATLYMNQLAKYDYNVFQDELRKPPPFKELRLFWTRISP